MKTEFLVDIVPRDAPIAEAVCNGDNAPPCMVTPTFFADGEKRWTLSRSWRYGADVLVTPWYNASRTLEILARARLAGARLIHYPSEQIFSRLFDREKLNTACASAYRRHVDAVLVWGEYYARRLVQEVGYPRERIYEVGSPRLELARTHAIERTWCAPGPKRVLFVSDFTIADLQRERQRRAFARTYGAPISTQDVRQLDAERRYMLDTARLVASMDGFEARVRPHPGERTDIYRHSCDGTGIQFANPATELSADIRWADVVVGYTSTSIFEVAAAGRPFLALRREAPPALVWREVLESLYPVCSAEELVAVLQDPRMLKLTAKRLVRQATFCVGNITSGYDPVAAIQAALHHVLERPPASLLRWTDHLTVAWGAVRAGYKYLALRFFASRAWHALGLWQPAAVRRRLSAEHSLTDEVIARYRGQMVDSAVRTGHLQPSITWQLGPWCWKPSESATATNKAAQDGTAADVEKGGLP